MRILMLFIAVCLVFFGCDLLGDTSDWTVVLPEFPAQWLETFPSGEADLVTVGADGTVAIAPVQAASLRFRVHLRKERNSLVLFYYHTETAEERFRPLGAVFPADADIDAHTLTFSVAGGFVGERLMRLAERGFPVACFNTERLLALIAEKEGDPWDFDPLLLETRLAEKNFSVYALKKLPVREVILTLPAGEWFNESPFSPLWSVEEGDDLVIPELSYGYHTLYSRGTGDRVYLSISEKDVIVFRPSLQYSPVCSVR